MPPQATAYLGTKPLERKTIASVIYRLLSRCNIVVSALRIPPQGEWRRAATQKALLILLFKRFLTKRIGPEEEVLSTDTDI